MNSNSNLYKIVQTAERYILTITMVVKTHCWKYEVHLV